MTLREFGNSTPQTDRESNLRGAGAEIPDALPRGLEPLFDQGTRLPDLLGSLGELVSPHKLRDKLQL